MIAFTNDISPCGRVAALFACALIASLSWVPSADAGFIYEVEGFITQTSGEVPPSDGQFPFSAGDAFDATFEYTPETAMTACGDSGVGAGCDCFYNFLSYEIRIGAHEISPGSVSGCLSGSSMVDDWPTATFTPDGLFAEEFWWDIDLGGYSGSSLPSSEDFMTSLSSSKWYMFFLSYDADIQTVFGQNRSVTQVPEPATLALFLCGLLAFGQVVRGKARR